MPKTSFRVALKENAAARLAELGYVFDEALREENVIYGFSKRLSAESVAHILFIRDQDTSERAYGYGFEVILERKDELRSDETAEPVLTGVRPDLAFLLWVAYGLRLFPEIHHTWSPAGLDQLKADLSQVIDLIAAYGLPWLENPSSRRITPLGLDHWNEFQAAFTDVVIPAVTDLGFHVIVDKYQDWPPHRAAPHRIFQKVLSDGSYLFVLFHPGVEWRDRRVKLYEYVPTAQPGKTDQATTPYMFDVLLFRKRSTNPYSQSTCVDGKCFQRRLTRSSEFAVELTEPVPEAAIWRYEPTSSEQLRHQLMDALRVLASGDLSRLTA